jgi:hypothetical protein
MSFDEEKKTVCFRCGKFVPTGNSYCGFCGALVSRPSSSSSTIELIGGRELTPVQQYPQYDRKFSTFTRIAKLLTSPKEVMNDIGLAPDYVGVIILFAIWTILTFVGTMVALTKMQFIGTYGTQVTLMVFAGVGGAMTIVPFVLIIRWLIKSYLIRHLCDGKSWDFQTAASVTGYAYLPNIIFIFIGIVISWLLLPSIVIDTTDLDQALVQLQLFEAQTAWFTIGLNTIFAIIAWIWKSYIGSYGAYSGTHRNCELNSALGNFMAIGGIGVLIDFIANFL